MLPEATYGFLANLAIKASVESFWIMLNMLDTYHSNNYTGIITSSRMNM